MDFGYFDFNDQIMILTFYCLFLKNERKCYILYSQCKTVDYFNLRFIMAYGLPLIQKYDFISKPFYFSNLETEKKMLNIQISRLSDVNLTSSNQFNPINKITNLNIILKIY